MADPGLPEAVAHSVADHVVDDLNRLTGSEPITWSVDVSRDTMPLTHQNEILLWEHAPDLRRDRGWDYVIYLTDLPRSIDNNSLVCSLDTPSRSALISLPALGAVRTTSKTRKMLTELIRSLQQEVPDQSSGVAGTRNLNRGGWRRIPRDDSNGSYDLVLTGPFNRPRLLAGMVRNNRPLRVLPALSGSTATAVATGAFGIFYTSIWNMADAASTSRMAMISISVVLAFTIWLVFHNGLWTRTRGASHDMRSWRDNAATFITLGIGVALMYVVLWAILFTVSMAVINQEYLASNLGHAVNLLDYLNISWLASALGMMAGAVGSNFDSESNIREATYTRRENVRRQLAETEDVDG